MSGFGVSQVANLYVPKNETLAFRRCMNADYSINKLFPVAHAPLFEMTLGDGTAPRHFLADDDTTLNSEVVATDHCRRISNLEKEESLERFQRFFSISSRGVEALPPFNQYTHKGWRRKSQST
jgi:hypothetical protein